MIRGFWVGYLCVGLMVAPVLARAQANVPKANYPDPKALQTIWDAADERIKRQNDRWFKAGDFPRTIQALKIRCELHPHDIEAMTDLGYMLENLHRYDEALSLYIRYRVRHSSDPESALPEASFYAKGKADAKVIRLLEPLIDRKPGPNIYRMLARSYERMGFYTDADRTWAAYLTRFPKDEQAKKNRERVRTKLAAALKGVKP